MRFVGEVQPPPDLVALTGGDELADVAVGCQIRRARP
jgi:hypothetical protein